MSAGEKVQGFIAMCKRELTGRVPDSQWNTLSWDITESTTLRGGARHILNWANQSRRQTAMNYYMTTLEQEPTEPLYGGAEPRMNPLQEANSKEDQE